MKTKIQIVNDLDDEFVFDDERIPRETKMNQEKRNMEPQFLYLGRWVSKTHFRAFVYSDNGSKLVNSYEEFEKEVATGLWFACESDLAASKVKPVRKPREAKPKEIVAAPEPIEEVIEPTEVEPEVTEDSDQGVIEYGSDR